MLKYVVRRLAISVPMLIVLTFLIFLLIEVAPGDAADAIAGENPPEGLVEAIRAELRLDEPLIARYIDWLTSALRGDFGNSYFSGRSVMDHVSERVSVTLSLTIVALTISLVFGFIGGIAGAIKPNGILDRAVTAVSAFMLAVPSFWLALLLVLYFSVERQLFPAIGYRPLSDGVFTWLRYLLLPAAALSINATAQLALHLKASLAAQGGSHYLLAARAKGLTRTSLLFKHALKNAAVPVVAILGFRIATMLGTTVIIETIFVLPGLGLLAQQAAITQDVPIILAVVTLTAVFVTVINVLTDVSYGFLNPKMRV